MEVSVITKYVSVKVAKVACMRKLVTILNAIFRDKKPWANA